jgi:hypothetical protein
VIAVGSRASLSLPLCSAATVSAAVSARTIVGWYGLPWLAWVGMSTASAASQRTCLERSNGAVRSAAVTSRPQSADDATNNPACNPQHARHNAACNRLRMMQHTMRHALVAPAACPASNARQGCVGPVTHSVGGDYSTDLYPEGSESTEALFEGWAHRQWLPQTDSGLLLAACAISTLSSKDALVRRAGCLPCAWNEQ